MTIYRGQGGLGDSYNDPELVHTSGDETIEGVKTFTSTIIGTASGHYTKAEEDTKLALKANQSTTFTKTEVNTLVDAKADQATTYTKTEVDTSLAGKLSSVPDNSVTTSKIAAGAVTPDKLSSTAQYMGFKNRIINGAMVIDNRNAGASSTPVGPGYTSCDRWNQWVSQASKYSVQRSTTAPAGFVNSQLVTSLSAYSVLAADYFALSQQIEGNNIADLGWGAAGAATVTLSFWVRSSLTGTFGGALSNSAVNRSYPFTYIISAANTWEQKTITIAGDTSGTWLTDTGIGIRVWLGLGVGSTYSGTAGAWAAGDYRSATGATSVVGTNGATFYITGVQLEKGSTATSFDYRPYGTELALCQRYYQAIAVGSYTFATAANQSVAINTPIQAPMRSAPTASEKTFISSLNVSSTYPPADVFLRADGCLLRAVSAGAGNQVDYRAVWQFSAEL